MIEICANVILHKSPHNFTSYVANSETNLTFPYLHISMGHWDNVKGSGSHSTLNRPTFFNEPKVYGLV